MLPEWIKTNQPLVDQNSWKVGGPAEFYVEPEDHQTLKEALLWAQKNSHDWTVLSSGTNVLIHDHGVRGLVVSTRKLNRFTTEVDEDRVFIRAESGVPKFELFKFFSKNKLDACLFLVGLPGDVGGGIVMNAGIGAQQTPREFCEITDWIDVMRPDGKVERVAATDIEWHYRGSRGWQPGVILAAQFSWPNLPNSELMKQVRLANKKRVSTQPLEMPSCGSTFRNPEGAKAGALIEQCGLKGFQIGGAQVSTKHSNFIVNLGDATAEEIDAVIRHVEAVVLQETGYKLKNEVVYMGDWQPR